MKRVANASLVFGAALALTLAGCHVTHPDLPAAAIVLTPAAVTVSALVTDAATGLPVSSTLSIYTQTGTTPVAGPMTSTAGFFTYVPGSVTAPVTYRLVASASGYATASQNLTITGAEVKADGSGLAAATIALNSTTTSTTAPVAVATGAASSTGTAAVITSTTPATSGIVGEASVTIPASTVLTTASGAPLTGTVSLVASYSNALTPASLASYPSGTQAIVNGTATTIVSAGAVTTTAKDASGNVAKNFSPAVNVTIPVPAGTLNPITNAAVKAGDTINIYYFGDDGLLVPLTTTGGAAVTATLGTEVGSGATGYFPATFPTTHFCTFNAAWTPATQTLTFTLTGTNGNMVNGLVYRTSGGWYAPITSNGDATFTLTNVPSGSDFSIILIVGGTAQTYTLPLGGTISMTTQVGSVSLRNTNILVQASSTRITLPVPSAVVLATPVSGKSGSVVGATDTTGHANLSNLVSNISYVITAFYPGLTPNATATLPAGSGTLVLTYTVPDGYTGITGATF